MWPFKLPAESNSKGNRPGKRTNGISKHASKQRKKNGNINGNQNKPQQPTRYTRLSEEERQVILELRREGLSAHAIAEELGRSSRTIHTFLKKQGLSSSAKPASRGISSQSKSIGEDPEDSLSALLQKQMGPFLAEESRNFLRKNPEVVEQFLWACVESTPPKLTVDDRVDRWIGDSPELLRRMAEHRVMMMERNGQSELDIVGRWLPMILQFAELLNQGNWARVTESGIRSGELRRTIVETVALLKNQNTVPTLNQEVGKSGPANRPQSNPSSLMAPQDTPGELSLADASPSYLRAPGTQTEGFLNSAITWPHEQTDLKGVRNDSRDQWPKKSFAAIIREPLPDMSAQLAEVKDNPGELSPPVSPDDRQHPSMVKEEFLNSKKPNQAKAARIESRRPKSRQHNAKLVAAIRKPIPGMSAQLAEIMNSPGMLRLASTLEPDPLTDSETQDCG